jgi:hypothetical protein
MVGLLWIRAVTSAGVAVQANCAHRTVADQDDHACFVSRSSGGAVTARIHVSGTALIGSGVACMPSSCVVLDHPYSGRTASSS